MIALPTIFILFPSLFYIQCKLLFCLYLSVFPLLQYAFLILTIGFATHTRIHHSYYTQ
eukprot:UN02686